MLIRGVLLSLFISYIAYGVAYSLIPLQLTSLIVAVIVFFISLMFSCIVSVPLEVRVKGKIKDKGQKESGEGVEGEESDHPTQRVMSVEGLGFLGFLIGYVVSCFFLRGSGSDIREIFETSLYWGVGVGGVTLLFAGLLKGDED